MKASLLVTLALCIVFSQAATVLTNATVGTLCASQPAMCSASNAAYCCASINNYYNGTATRNITTVSEVCLNATVLTLTGKYNTTLLNGTATCVASTTMNALFVKLSVAVASLGFLALFV
jgi:hypothetical protein